MSRLRPSGLVALALVVACAAPRALVEDGERQLARGAYAEAMETFQRAAEASATTGLDQLRARVGEARALIGLGRLDDAAAKLEALPDPTSARWYYLGEIALARGRRAEAAACYREALERTHGGDTSRKLARVLAGEARAPEAFEDAIAVLERGGERGQAEALTAALEVWRELLRGGSAAPLLERLEAAEAEVGTYPAIRVLRARLLARLQRTLEAAEAWDLEALDPSSDYLAFAQELRAQLALEAGDEAALTQALETATVETAARFRSRLAEARALRGDLSGALSALRATVERGGAPAPDALSRVAWLEELRGLPHADQAWRRAAEQVSGAEAAVGARVGLRRAREGDLLAAADLLRPRLAGLPPDLVRDARRVLRASDLLREAVAAFLAEVAPARGLVLEGRPVSVDRTAAVTGTTRHLARAVRLLVPADPAAAALLAALEERTPRDQAARLTGATGATQAALDAAALTLLLRTAQLEAASALLAARGAALDAALARELEAGLTRALADGRADDARAFVAGLGPRLTPELMARLRSSARFAPLVGLPEPRGLLAWPEGLRAAGALAGPAGLRLPRLLLERRGDGWSLELPEGSRLDLRADAPGADPLDRVGAPADGLTWTSHPELEAAEAAPFAALRERACAPPFAASSVLELD